MSHKHEREAIRDQALAWLERLGYEVSRIDLLPGDVSPRRYFRIALGSRTAVVAHYPDELRSAFSRYLDASALLRAAGARVADVEAEDAALGFMLLEDLGSSTLYDRRAEPWSRLIPLLEDALRQQEKIAALDHEAVARLNPPLDQALLLRELDLTWEVFLEPEGLERERGLGRDLNAALLELCRDIAATPQRPCHRDYMARNLVPLRENLAALRRNLVPPRGWRVAVLDHQDLRLGPPEYDLASLLNDSLYPPPAVVEEVAGSRLAADRLSAYHRCAAQRCLKIVGTFRRFAAGGSDRHLPLVPPSLERALAHLAQLAELDGAALARSLRGFFADLLNQRV